MTHPKRERDPGRMDDRKLHQPNWKYTLNNLSILLPSAQWYHLFCKNMRRVGRERHPSGWSNQARFRHHAQIGSNYESMSINLIDENSEPHNGLQGTEFPIRFPIWDCMSFVSRLDVPSYGRAEPWRPDQRKERILSLANWLESR